MIRLDPPSPEKTPSPGDRRLSTYSFPEQTIWALYPTPYRSGNVGLTHFLMKHLGEVGTRKKRPARGSFFFLPAFGRCCPLVSSCKPAQLVAQQGMARLRVLVLPLGHHLQAYVPTTKHGSVLLSHFGRCCKPAWPEQMSSFASEMFEQKSCKRNVFSKHPR